MPSSQFDPTELSEAAQAGNAEGMSQEIVDTLNDYDTTPIEDVLAAGAAFYALCLYHGHDPEAALEEIIEVIERGSGMSTPDLTATLMQLSRTH